MFAFTAREANARPASFKTLTMDSSPVSVPPKVDIPTPKNPSGQDADVNVRLWISIPDSQKHSKGTPGGFGILFLGRNGCQSMGY